VPGPSIHLTRCLFLHAGTVWGIPCTAETTPYQQQALELVGHILVTLGQGAGSLVSGANSE
jgi:hypothetical protein